MKVRLHSVLKLTLTLISTVLVSGISPATASPSSFRTSSLALDLDLQLQLDITRATTEVFDYFQGEWLGAGEFASGKRIEANVSFNLELGGNWMIHRHIDKAPNKFQSVAFWGVERNHQFLTMMLVDNFKNIREFRSTGFSDDTLVFEDVPQVTISSDDATARRRERFTFIKLKSDLFQMTYESNTNGQGWKLGDWILFQRQRKTSE